MDPGGVVNLTFQPTDGVRSMSLNSKVFPAPADNPGKIKHLFLRPESPAQELDYEPFFYVEARIDFSDVRSGYHATLGMNSVLDMIPLDAEIVWTRDMVRPVDAGAIQTTRPEAARLRTLPPFVTAENLSQVETQYLAYLMRNAEVRVFRNFALDSYSFPGESRDDFQARCLDMLHEPFRHDLDAMREVVNRRLARIEEKYLISVRSGEFESDRRTTQGRSRLHAVAEGIADLFLSTELTLGDSDLEPRHPDPRLPDLEQRLQTLEADVFLEIQRLLNSYQEKIRNIDEYVIHPNHRDLHLVRTCILWMPAGATGR